MASAEKLPSGRWRGLYRDAAGNKQRVLGTFPRKSDAKDAAIDAEAKAKRKAAAKTGQLSPRTPWGQWWEIFNADRHFDSAHGQIEARNVRIHVGPKWNDVPLNAIAKHGEHGIQPWVDGLVRQGYSPHSVRNILRPLRTSLNAAVDRGILTASPCTKIKLPRVPKGPKSYLTASESDKLAAARLNQRYVDAVNFDLEMGLRPGELAGLHADRIDFDRKVLLVAEVYVEGREVIRSKPKDEDLREIPLTDVAIEIVHRQLEGRELHGGCGVPHLNGKPCTSVLVWRNLAGGPMRPSYLGRRMRAAADKARIPRRAGYSLRRGFATRAIEGGADVFTVQTIMGHADLDELSRYVQTTEESRAKLRAALGERPQLRAVGPRGTDRGTDLDNQTVQSATNEDETDAG